MFVHLPPFIKKQVCFGSGWMDSTSVLHAGLRFHYSNPQIRDCQFFGQMFGLTWSPEVTFGYIKKMKKCRSALEINLWRQEASLCSSDVQSRELDQGEKKVALNTGFDLPREVGTSNLSLMPRVCTVELEGTRTMFSQFLPCKKNPIKILHSTKRPVYTTKLVWWLLWVKWWYMRLTHVEVSPPLIS